MLRRRQEALKTPAAQRNSAGTAMHLPDQDDSIQFPVQSKELMCLDHKLAISWHFKNSIIELLH